MSTETPAPPAQPQAPPTTGAPAPTPAAPTPTPPPAQETDWKAESRKWEDRAKENKTAADELAALKAAQMTESEKAAARLAELETTVKGYQTKEQISTWKTEVSEATGVPAAALAGSTLEEIQAHAETLKPLITPAPTPFQAGPTVPNPGKTPGVSVSGQWTKTDLKGKKPEEVEAARVAGLLDDILNGRAQ